MYLYIPASTRWQGLLEVRNHETGKLPGLFDSRILEGIVAKARARGAITGQKIKVSRLS